MVAGVIFASGGVIFSGVAASCPAALQGCIGISQMLFPNPNFQNSFPLVKSVLGISGCLGRMA